MLKTRVTLILFIFRTATNY